MKVNGKDNIPYIMENKKCSKPPISYDISIYQSMIIYESIVHWPILSPFFFQKKKILPMTGTHGPNSRTLWGTTQMTNICSPLILGPLGLTDVDCLWPLDILSELAMSSEETLPVGQFFRHPQNNGHFNTNPQFYFFSQRGKKTCKTCIVSNFFLSLPTTLTLTLW